MKFSEQWLREWVNPKLKTTELVEQLTMAGLEVDAVAPVAADFSGVVVAELLSVEPHPDADKLSVCQVSTGEANFQVVCGAPNARAGLKVALAKVGAQLSPEFTIKQAKLRGVESQGMLCSEEELGLSDASEGILELASDAPIGTNFRDYLGLDDQLIEVDLTPNRGDCLGIAGLARDVGVLNKLEVSGPTIKPIPAMLEESFPVRIEAPADCPKYVGRVIRGIDITAATPLWMVERLRRSGIRSIDPVVDVTNYVMLELGQPMHAFDVDQLRGGIVVRRAQSDEKLRLLDGKDIALDPDTLVIADASGPLAMAGIMGGENSGVSSATRNIFLESAFFNPVTIAGRARVHGLHTDSSHRFERGVDFQVQELAVERATELLVAIVGGEPGPIVLECDSDSLPKRDPVPLRRTRIEQVLNLSLEDAEIEDMLVRLGMEVLERSDEGWLFNPPSYRFDVAIEADLLEEIARIYGYNRLPVSVPSAALTPKFDLEQRINLNSFRHALLMRGYNETLNYSFVDPQLQSKIDKEQVGIELANPISADMAVMRTSLWPGLIQALIFNLNRQQNRVRLFETGMTFLKIGEKIVQKVKIAGIIAGRRLPEGWTQAVASVDFFDLKGDVEALISLTGSTSDYSFVSGEHAALHPGQTASVYSRDQVIGWIGALHPNLESELDIKGPVYLFELDLEALQQGRLPRFEELSKFPEVRRDLAIIVDEQVPLAQVLSAVTRNAGENLTDLKLFDLYQGKGIESGRKSIALGLTWQHRSRTLTDGEVSQLVDSIINNLEKEFNAVLRG